jgi:hypothetical protein
VPQTIAALAEALAAVLTLVWFFASVSPGVFGKGGQVAVAFAAHLAVVWLLAGVDALMSYER